MVWTDPLQEGRVPFAKIPLVVWRWKGEWGWGGVKWGVPRIGWWERYQKYRIGILF